ncbi:M23 family metallopeptidase [Kitasatospora sp. NPDC052896]|uniref:M23 family metallopeptidase n=1 Tax=Kitasatospora sp. NPDC052896 TaxID=3364061 RepID=UPI0037CADA78
MASTHTPESRTQAGGTQLLDFPDGTGPQDGTEPAPFGPEQSIVGEEAARHRLPRQSRSGAPVLGVTAMAAALGATGFSASAAAAATPGPAAPAPTTVAAPEQPVQPAHAVDVDQMADHGADPGLALAARIQQQADTRRTAAEEAARVEAAREAAAKREAQARAEAQAQAEAQARAEAEAEAARQAAAQAAEAAQAEEAARAAAVRAATAQVAEEQGRAVAGTAAVAVVGPVAVGGASGEGVTDQAGASDQAGVSPVVGPFALPVASSYALGPGYGQPGGHWAHLQTGADFAAPAGSAVAAVAGGTVSSAGWSGSDGYRVVQTLSDGTQLWYCHLSAITVPAGPVAAGTVLGKVGATGNVSMTANAAVGGVSGPRLRLEVRPGGGAPVDALGWLRGHGLNP